MYDYIIVGSGLYGAIFAHEAMKAGKSCLVVERRSHIGGNIYTKEMEGIQVHQYGAHIFHTSNKEVWDYIGQFATFNRYTNCPVAGLFFSMEIFSCLSDLLQFNYLSEPDHLSAPDLYTVSESQSSSLQTLSGNLLFSIHPYAL